MGGWVLIIANKGWWINGWVPFLNLYTFGLVLIYVQMCVKSFPLREHILKILANNKNMLFILFRQQFSAEKTKVIYNCVNWS